jgi:hypothetical protein
MSLRPSTNSETGRRRNPGAALLNKLHKTPRAKWPNVLAQRIANWAGKSSGNESFSF